MLSGRPDVRSAERSLEAAFYGTRTLYFRANYYTYPTYGGSVQIGTEKKRYSVVFKNNTNENSRLLGLDVYKRQA